MAEIIEHLEGEIINRVANSGLVTLNLEDYCDPTELRTFDMKDCLFMGLILKEKDFREFIKQHDWQQYQNQAIAIICSADAIVPTWAYMLLASRLEPYAAEVFFGSPEELKTQRFIRNMNAKIDWESFRDKSVVIKGCGEKEVPIRAYVEAVTRLRPIAKKIMYGEPCSTVPIYKK
ncbi:MAG: DUF2480 family protein [Bacteroidia bacterium]|nr:DUF2480 family protein [Bacteroidia bacterium]